MRPQYASAEVQAAVFDVQGPRVPIEIICTDLPNLFLREMHHVGQRSARQRAVHESLKRLALLRIADVLRFPECR